MKNACVVGYGAVGPVHAAAISDSEYAKLYAICDIEQDKTNECKKKYGCIAYNDFDIMLQDENIDVVHICTPHYLHKDMAVKALLSGKHVVLEKPIAMNDDELDELEEVVNKSDKKLCVMVQNRANVCVEKMHEIASDDCTGKLVGIIGNLNWKRTEEYYASGEWRGKWDTEGGGLLINQALHLVDLMLYFGGNVKEMHSDIKRWKIKNIEVEDTASALFEFESGARGIFNATNCYITDEPYYIELKFENRHLRYADGFLYDITENGCNVIAKDDVVMIGKGYWGCGHHTVISNFYSSLEGTQMKYSSFDDVKNSMKTVFSFYKEGRRV